MKYYLHKNGYTIAQVEDNDIPQFVDDSWIEISKEKYESLKELYN